MTTASRQSTFVSLARDRVRAFWQAYHELVAMQDEWNAADYANTLADGAGENAGIVRADVGAAVFDTMNEVKARIFDTGHKTNLSKLL